MEVVTAQSTENIFGAGPNIVTSTPNVRKENIDTLRKSQSESEAETKKLGFRRSLLPKESEKPMSRKSEVGSFSQKAKFGVKKSQLISHFNLSLRENNKQYNSRVNRCKSSSFSVSKMKTKSSSPKYKAMMKQSPRISSKLKQKQECSLLKESKFMKKNNTLPAFSPASKDAKNLKKKVLKKEVKSVTKNETLTNKLQQTTEKVKELEVEKEAWKKQEAELVGENEQMKKKEAELVGKNEQLKHMIVVLVTVAAQWWLPTVLDYVSSSLAKRL